MAIASSAFIQHAHFSHQPLSRSLCAITLAVASLLSLLLLLLPSFFNQPPCVQGWPPPSYLGTKYFVEQSTRWYLITSSKPSHTARRPTLLFRYQPVPLSSKGRKGHAGISTPFSPTLDFTQAKRLELSTVICCLLGNNFAQENSPFSVSTFTPASIIIRRFSQAAIHITQLIANRNGHDR